MVSFRFTLTLTNFCQQHQEQQEETETPVAGAIKIRVITPALARTYKDFRSIPVLRGRCL